MPRVDTPMVRFTKKFQERFQLHLNPLVLECLRIEVDEVNFLHKNQISQVFIPYNVDNNLFDREGRVVYSIFSKPYQTYLTQFHEYVQPQLNSELNNFVGWEVYPGPVLSYFPTYYKPSALLSSLFQVLLPCLKVLEDSCCGCSP